MVLGEGLAPGRQRSAHPGRFPVRGWSAGARRSGFIAAEPARTALRSPDEDGQQLADEVELGRIGRAEQGDLVGQGPQRIVAVGVERSGSRRP